MALVPSEIANMALGQLGARLQVVNFDTDQSEQANCCRTYNKQAVREILEDFPWPFATIQQPLQLLELPFSREYRFAYAYPANCIVVRRLFSPRGFNRNDDVQTRQKYRIIQTANPADSSQQIKVLLADHPNLQVEFTGDDKIVADFSAGFKKALAFLLAYYMAPRLTAGDPYKLGDRARANYVQAANTAMAHAANEEVMDPQRLGEFIDTRNRTDFNDQSTHIENYPSGILIG